jgi:hypothetical protein
MKRNSKDLELCGRNWHPKPALEQKRCPTAQGTARVSEALCQE